MLLHCWGKSIMLISIVFPCYNCASCIHFNSPKVRNCWGTAVPRRSPFQAHLVVNIGLYPINSIRRLSCRSELKEVCCVHADLHHSGTTTVCTSTHSGTTRELPRLHLPTHSCGATNCAPNPRERSPLPGHESISKQPPPSRVLP